MYLQAYQKAQARSESPRETEYRLFANVTAALLKAQGVPRHDPRLIEAIDWNRRLWSTLANDCADEANGLPPALRAQIISLSIFVMRHSGAVMRGEADLGPLVEINRSIMQGLEQR